MGLFDFFRKKVSPKVYSDTTPESIDSTVMSKLTYVEKERIMVERVTINDMKSLTALPYLWNSKVKKFISQGGHPFAYMDLTGDNINIAKSELQKVNHILTDAHHVAPVVPFGTIIPIDDIVFFSKDRGYTRLICTPHTFTGVPSKYPASLSFMTDLASTTSTTHGDLFYGHDGTVQAADVYCWRKGIGYFYHLKAYDGELAFEKIECTKQLDANMKPTVVYKSPYLLAAEATREQEEKDFLWCQINIPGKCPKSLSGYRRMKTQNTKNYQILKQLAAELGKEI